VKAKVSPTVIGFFVLGAMLLGLISLFSFGGINFFGKPQRFVIYFDESVHGLDLGSPVKLRGVRVGRVSQINLTYDDTRNRSQVAVMCELSRNVVVDPDGVPLDVSQRAELEALIDRGLRAQLGVIGLATGLLYVELDFRDPANYPRPPMTTVSLDYATVPAIPSTISEFQASFSDILANLKHVDFAGISDELKGLLTDTRGKINQIDTAELIAKWTAAADAVDALARSERISGVLDNLDTTLTEFRSTLATLDGAVGPTSEQLTDTLQKARDSLEAFNKVAATAQLFISAQSGVGAEAAAALRDIGEASQAIARLADFLERNPNALLTGRAPPR